MEDRYIVKVKMDAGPFEIDGKYVNVITADDIRKAKVESAQTGVLGAIAGLILGREKGTYSEESVDNDLREIAKGLEYYYLDNDKYPDSLDKLTAPVAYLTSIPEDRYGSEGDKAIRYATDGKNKWALQSRGPDGDFDADLKEFLDSSMGKEFFLGTNPGEKYIYNPLKHVGESGGDIIRVGP